MSNSHRKRKRRSTRGDAASAQPQPATPAPGEATSRATGGSPPPVEVPFIGPPRRKPSRAVRDEPPALPAGALASLSITGGMVFSQRELVVYDDGRLTYAALGRGQSQTQQASHLSDEQVAAVRAELDALSPRAFAGRRASPPPDAYAYDIAARLGDEVASTTVSTAFIPPALAPLLRVLRDLVPRD